MGATANRLAQAIENKDVTTVQSIMDQTKNASEGTALSRIYKDANSWMSAVGAYLPNTTPSSVSSGGSNNSVDNTLNYVTGGTPTGTMNTTPTQSTFGIGQDNSINGTNNGTQNTFGYATGGSQQSNANGYYDFTKTPSNNLGNTTTTIPQKTISQPTQTAATKYSTGVQSAINSGKYTQKDIDSALDWMSKNQNSKGSYLWNFYANNYGITPEDINSFSGQGNTQPQDQQNVGLRDTLEKLGYKVDFKDGTVYANGVPVDVTGLMNNNGTYVGTQDQIDKALNLIKSGYNPQTGQFANNNYFKLRDAFKNENVQWDANTGTVSINGVKIDTSNLPLVNGSYYVSPADIANIAKEINTFDQKGTGNQVDTQKDNQTTFEQSLNTLGFSDVLNQLASQNKNMQVMVNDFTNQMSTSYQMLKDQMTQSAQIINQAFGNGFTYDQNNDRALQSALKFAENKLKQSLIGRGMLYSTEGTDQYAQVLSDLIPKYEELAYEKYVKNIQLQMQRAESLGQLSQNSFSAVSQFANNMLNMTDKLNNNTLDTLKEMVTISDKVQSAQEAQVQNQLKAQKQEFDQALDRVKTRGYVDNNDALILGLRPGTFAPEDRARLENQQFQIAKYQQELKDQKAVREENFQNDLKKIQFTKNLNDAGKVNASIILAGMISNVPSNQWDAYITENKDVIAEKTGASFSDLIDTIQKLKQQKVDNYYKDQANARSWEANQRSADANARADESNKLSRERFEYEKQQKESSKQVLSYSEIDSLLKQTIDNYKNSKNESVKNNSWQKPGSVEAMNLTNIVGKNGKNLTRDQKEALLRKYNIPILGE